MGDIDKHFVRSFIAYIESMPVQLIEARISNRTMAKTKQLMCVSFKSCLCTNFIAGPLLFLKCVSPLFNSRDTKEENIKRIEEKVEKLSTTQRVTRRIFAL